MKTQLIKNGKIGTLTIRRNETEARAYIQFEDGSDDLKVYSRGDTEEEIVTDLVDYYEYELSGKI